MRFDSGFNRPVSQEHVSSMMSQSTIGDSHAVLVFLLPADVISESPRVQLDIAERKLQDFPVSEKRKFRDSSVSSSEL